MIIKSELGIAVRSPVRRGSAHRSVPFTASVSIRSITVKAGPSGQTPREMHLVSISHTTAMSPVIFLGGCQGSSSLSGGLGNELTEQYRDSPGMDFGDTDRAATQVLEMVEENEGVEYQVK